LSFGAFDFAGFERKGDLCHTRAADDLAGCVIALGALIDERRTRAKNKRRLFAIFTRAEEVGFIGCLDLLKRKELPARALYISLEASRTLPEAELGKGPVLRLGDRATLFDPKMTTALNEVALELSTERGARQFRYQRRLMPGGTCEGTALALHGYTTAALAVPLLNYHNQAFDGSRRGPRPEIISINDTDLARRFCFEAAQRLPRHLDSATRTKARIDRNFAQLKDRLSTDT
jgi:endoglucanase